MRNYFALSELHDHLCSLTRGDAPHVVRRLPLAIIFRAFGAGVLAYSAPSALASRLIPLLRRWRSSLVRASGPGVPAYSAPSALATQTFVHSLSAFKKKWISLDRERSTV